MLLCLQGVEATRLSILSLQMGAVKSLFIASLYVLVLLGQGAQAPLSKDT